MWKLLQRMTIGMKIGLLASMLLTLSLVVGGIAIVQTQKIGV